MFGAKTVATLCAFILFRCSCWTTSAIRLIAQSNRAASVGGRFLARLAQSSSVRHSITCSGDNESRTPVGSSLNQAWTNSCLQVSIVMCWKQKRKKRKKKKSMLRQKRNTVYRWSPSLTTEDSEMGQPQCSIWRQRICGTEAINQAGNGGTKELQDPWL